MISNADRSKLNISWHMVKKHTVVCSSFWIDSWNEGTRVLFVSTLKTSQLSQSSHRRIWPPPSTALVPSRASSCWRMVQKNDWIDWWARVVDCNVSACCLVVHVSSCFFMFVPKLTTSQNYGENPSGHVWLAWEHVLEQKRYSAKADMSDNQQQML